ncbi:hypothetical protein Tco_1333013, partial [Tanacetum coccineum]
TAFETRVRQDMDEVYKRLGDEQSQRQLLAGRLNMLFRDRRAHARTARLIETEARMFREAWGRSMDASDLACAEETGCDFRDTEVSIERGDSTTRTGDHLAGAGDSPTGTGHSITGIGYCTTGTSGTRWRFCIARKMAPKRATRSILVTTIPALTATTTTSVTNAQLQAMTDQGVTATLAARDANRNGDYSHTLGTGGRRTERIVRECTYQDFMKCKPLYLFSKSIREL